MEGKRTWAGSVVAIRWPNWREAPQGEVIQDLFLDGLNIILEDKNITIVRGILAVALRS